MLLGAPTRGTGSSEEAGTTARSAGLALEIDPRSVGVARRHVQMVLDDAGLGRLTEAAVLAVSEIVTNAIVHASGPVELRVLTSSRAARVEVEDHGGGLPTVRDHADAAGTGRGLALVASTTTRWGVVELLDGKVVWFEVGTGEVPGAAGTRPVLPTSNVETVEVALLRVPLLMHVAWQEHAAALLRELLLWSLDVDPDALTAHAEASEALSLLHDQLPVPDLGAEPEVLMGRAVEPHVTAERVALRVPVAAVPHFATLDELLRRGMQEARAGRFLCPPTQPEIEEMRQWLCSEVLRQAAGDSPPAPWVARTDVSTALAGLADPAAHQDLDTADEPVVAMDDAGILVAASPAALSVLGHAEAADLVGRRLVAVVPERFRQAHVAGTTMNATNGRDVLLAVPVRVPMLRADDTEVLVEMTVCAEMHDERRLFVARFRPV